eukprot:5160097-Amphidinium_carterae.1
MVFGGFTDLLLGREEQKVTCRARMWREKTSAIFVELQGRSCTQYILWSSVFKLERARVPF